ncbi:hypothetical protein C2G38_2167322 [Gigaspora rosea]|uniref:Uncharacterized protein n=1 Tax=Gigaspora rosea TaxID=44941 RepID=A0A397W0S6_9GLOM|nr:hypothetical protein C2G38_2167322 [Gigaspora rosea]
MYVIYDFNKDFSKNYKVYVITGIIASKLDKDLAKNYEKRIFSRKIRENGSEVLFVATWLNGIRKVEKSECSYKQSRIAGHVVNLISLPSLNASEFIEETYPVHISLFFPGANYKSTQDWTSGDEYIDKCIREFQLKATNCKKVIEWIPFNKLTNLQKIRKNECEILFVATWLAGYVLEQYMQLSDSIVYGITKDTTTSGYMIVVPDEFNSIRNEFFGECKYCRQHNTFFAWCQLCDPREAAQDWTSGDEYIDECIKKFQLKTTNYEKIIE